jgi:hypothetical protein
MIKLFWASHRTPIPHKALHSAEISDTGKVVTKTMVMWFDKHLGSPGRLTGGVLFGAIDTSKYTGHLAQVPK